MMLGVNPIAHSSSYKGDLVHSSFLAASAVVAEEGVKVESPQRSEENRP